MPQAVERMRNGYGYGAYNTLKNFHYCSNPPRHKFPMQILLQIKLLWKSSENILRLTQFRYLRLAALIPLVNISVPTTVYSSKRNKLSHTQNLITSIFLPTSMQSQHLVKPLLFVDSHLGGLDSALFRRGNLGIVLGILVFMGMALLFDPMTNWWFSLSIVALRSCET